MMEIMKICRFQCG